MNITIFAFTVLLAVQATANPFAAVSKNTPEAGCISNLPAKAKPTSNSQLSRKLDQNVSDIDLTGYVVKYDRCQSIQGYSDEEAQASNGTVLGTSHFVVFRLCPTGTCNSCTSEFGEYVVDLKDYLFYAADFQQKNQTNVCNACDLCANATDTSMGVDCSICADECKKIRAVGTNGIYEATNFTSCLMVYDPDDDTLANTRYGRVTCASSGKFTISVFTDSDCINVDTSASIENYATSRDGYNGRISFAIMKTVYNSTNCIPCDDNGATSNMCTSLYTEATKCETSLEFVNGTAAAENGNYSQVMQEDHERSYINFLTNGTTDTEAGEVNVSVSSMNSVEGNKTSGGQKFALSFFILGTFGLALFAV